MIARVVKKEEYGPAEAKLVVEEYRKYLILVGMGQCSAVESRSWVACSHPLTSSQSDTCSTTPRRPPLGQGRQEADSGDATSRMGTQKLCPWSDTSFLCFILLDSGAAFAAEGRGFAVHVEGASLLWCLGDVFGGFEPVIWAKQSVGSCGCLCACACDCGCGCGRQLGLLSRGPTNCQRLVEPPSDQPFEHWTLSLASRFKFGPCFNRFADHQLRIRRCLI